jgi:hypothetical protein
MSVQRSVRKPVVYLAGGFASGWQDIVKARCPAAIYRDPRTHGLADPRDYTVWDLAAVREADILFAVLEATNPGGYALALEVGYAKGLGKYIVLVDEKSAADPATRSYLEMLRTVSDGVYDSLEGGVSALARVLRSKFASQR